MAVKGYVDVQGFETNAIDNTKIDVGVRVAILGNDQGDYGSNAFTLNIYGLTPSTLNLLNGGISAAVLDDMDFHGVNLGLLDTVLIG